MVAWIACEVCHKVCVRVNTDDPPLVVACDACRSALAPTAEEERMFAALIAWYLARPEAQALGPCSDLIDAVLSEAWLGIFTEAFLHRVTERLVGMLRVYYAEEDVSDDVPF
jgi:hypothetical protein